MFQTNASASNGSPSWNFTPCRRVKIQVLGSLGSCFHAVASPGRRSAGASAFERSQRISDSKIG
jgi:hypothetical protein